jgi:hypothetical protein
MGKKTANCLLLVKLQPTANTDAAPTGAANAILAQNISMKPISAEFVKRKVQMPYKGNPGSVFAAGHSEVSFEIELAGSGAAGTAPKYGPLLRGSAWSETVTAGTSVVYAPVSTAEEFVTLWYWLDGVLYKCTDAQGTVAFDYNAKNIPVMKYRFIGLCAPIADAALPVGVDYTGFKDPLAVNAANTPTCTLHGIAGKFESVNIDMAATLAYRNVIGGESINNTDRDPSGTMLWELQSIATKDWYAALKSATLGPLSLIHGTIAGNIVELACPKTQVIDIDQQDSEGIAMLQAKLDIRPNTGNDEAILTVR